MPAVTVLFLWLKRALRCQLEGENAMRALGPHSSLLCRLGCLLGAEAGSQDSIRFSADLFGPYRQSSASVCQGIDAPGLHRADCRSGGTNIDSYPGLAHGSVHKNICAPISFQLCRQGERSRSRRHLWLQSKSNIHALIHGLLLPRSEVLAEFSLSACRLIYWRLGEFARECPDNR